MTFRIGHFLLLFFSPLLLTACDGETIKSNPVELTRSANGYYCGMIVVDHPGPKAQVHEAHRSNPRWFSSVRDALVYLRLPGEAQKVTGVYVHDMGQADSWDKPQNDGIWIRAEEAHYVIESSRRGGMGAKETVPFANAELAEKFVDEFGGRVVAYRDIGDDYVLGDKKEHKEESVPANQKDHSDHKDHVHPTNHKKEL